MIFYVIMSLNVGLSNKTGNNLSRGLNMVESSLRVFNNMNRLHKYTLAKRLEPFFSLRCATIASASLRGAKFNSLQNTELRHKFAAAATFRLQFVLTSGASPSGPVKKKAWLRSVTLLASRLKKVRRLFINFV